MRQLREELNWCYRQLDAADLQGSGRDATVTRYSAALAVAAPPSSCAAAVSSLERRLIGIMNRMRSRDLDFDALHAGGEHRARDHPQPVLPADTLLLEFYEARGTVFGFVVGRDRIEVRPLGQRPTRVRRALGFLQFQLSKHQLGEPYVTTFAESLLERHPVASSRAPPSAGRAAALLAPGARSLVVVPHGLLHRVPFHALWDGDAYLIDRFTRVLCAERQRLPPLLDPGSAGCRAARW